MGWREDATAVLKKALTAATEPKEIREISNALSSIQPYEEMGVRERPMAVRVVNKPKAKKKWVLPKKGK